MGIKFSSKIGQKMVKNGRKMVEIGYKWQSRADSAIGDADYVTFEIATALIIGSAVTSRSNIERH